MRVRVRGGTLLVRLLDLLHAVGLPSSVTPLLLRNALRPLPIGTPRA